MVKYFLILLSITFSLFAEINSTPKVYTSPKNETLNYRIYKPEDLDPNKKIPLVLFLHGSGQRGDDNVSQINHGFKDLVKYSQENKQPAIIIAPQLPLKTKWVDYKESETTKETLSEPSLQLKLSLDLIEELVKTLPVDSNRIYITGLSLGGYGTWEAIIAKPDYFAAAIPICGGGNPLQASKLVKTPIWAIHGGKDKVVRPSQSKDMIEAIIKAGGKPLYTEHPELAHDVWTITYSDKKILDWLFEQNKSAKQ